MKWKSQKMPSLAVRQNNFYALAAASTIWSALSWSCGAELSRSLLLFCAFNTVSFRCIDICIAIIAGCIFLWRSRHAGPCYLVRSTLDDSKSPNWNFKLVRSGAGLLISHRIKCKKITRNCSIIQIWNPLYHLIVCCFGGKALRWQWLKDKIGNFVAPKQRRGVYYIGAIAVEGAHSW